MHEDAENNEPSAPRRRMTSSARTTLAVVLAALMVSVAIIGGGLAWAFWSFSNSDASLGPGDSPEPTTPASSITASSSAETTAVPDVVSLPLSAATDMLRAAGFGVGTVTRVFVDGFLVGAVVAQSPLSAERSPVGSTVALTVSKGSLQPQRGDSLSFTVPKDRTPVPMPRITGMTLAQANSVCRELGLGMKLQPSGATQGIVYRQSPAAGVNIAPGSSASAWIDTPPSVSVSARVTKIDATWEPYNNALGAHVTCTSASKDDRRITSYRWQVEGLDMSTSGTGGSISFVIPGYRRYGSTSVILTAVDSAGQSSTARRFLRMNWDTGILQ